MRKIQLLLQLWKCLKWAADEEWQETDRKALEAYLCSESGQRTGRLLRNMAIRQQHNAVTSERNLEWACGRAAGFALAISVLDGLAQGQAGAPLENEPEEADIWETLRP